VSDGNTELKAQNTLQEINHEHHILKNADVSTSVETTYANTGITEVGSEYESSEELYD